MRSNIIPFALAVGLLFAALFLTNQSDSLTGNAIIVNGEANETWTASYKQGYLPQINVFPEDVTPQPVEPGQDLVVKLRVHNRDERMDAPHVTVSLDEMGPFKFKGGSQPSFNDMNICRGCSLANTYYLTVTSNTTSGTYPVYYVLQAGDYTMRKNLSIIVMGRPLLMMSTQVFDNLSPTESFTAKITLDNGGTGLARIIQTELDAPTYFAMMGSSEKSLPDVPSGGRASTQYTFSVSENTPAGVYTIPIQLLYFDEQNRNYSNSAEIGVRVVKKAKIDIETVKITPTTEGALLPKPGDPFSLIVRLQNVGYGDADYTNLELQGCPLEGNNKAFVGNLKRFEDSPAVFVVIAPKSGNYKCKLHATYRDDLGAHTLDTDFNFFIPTSGLDLGINTVLAALGAGILLLWLKKMG